MAKRALRIVKEKAALDPKDDKYVSIRAQLKSVSAHAIVQEWLGEIDKNRKMRMPRAALNQGGTAEEN